MRPGSAQAYHSNGISSSRLIQQAQSVDGSPLEPGIAILPGVCGGVIITRTPSRAMSMAVASRRRTWKSVIRYQPWKAWATFTTTPWRRRGPPGTRAHPIRSEFTRCSTASSSPNTSTASSTHRPSSAWVITPLFSAQASRQADISKVEILATRWRYPFGLMSSKDGWGVVRCSRPSSARPHGSRRGARTGACRARIFEPEGEWLPIGRRTRVLIALTPPPTSSLAMHMAEYGQTENGTRRVHAPFESSRLMPASVRPCKSCRSVLFGVRTGALEPCFRLLRVDSTSTRSIPGVTLVDIRRNRSLPGAHH